MSNVTISTAVECLSDQALLRETPLYKMRILMNIQVLQTFDIFCTRELSKSMDQPWEGGFNRVSNLLSGEYNG